MPEQSQFTPQSLLRYTESLRRELYDAVVRLIWTPTGPEEHIPAFTPDEAQLTVMFSHGRWIAIWIDLEEPANAPADQRAQMVRVLAAPESPFGIVFSEI
jgi:hypothetical protein